MGYGRWLRTLAARRGPAVVGNRREQNFDSPADGHHTGRRAPVRRSPRRARTLISEPHRHEAELAQRRTQRAQLRAVLVANAVLALLRDGPPSHQAVADRTGLPVGLLRWTYPTTADLVLAAYHTGLMSAPNEHSTDREGVSLVTRVSPLPGTRLPIALEQDPSALRAAFSLFPSGVAALSSVIDGKPVVLIASSFQVGISLDPPLVLFAVQHTSTRWPLLRAAGQGGGRIGVSILSEAHALVARQMAAKAADHFAGVDTTTIDSGAHFIHGAPVWIEASIHSEFPAGDHDVILLQVHASSVIPDTEPLVWHSSGFRHLAPKLTT
ncbi:flavin reductase family protein [Kineococcus sp. SYSU DK003]|uniref:flavin reductase family protein n=1 Tax=Kineococcus sp. SYSU DK003 TaxID=3383124 RepID=UPI003D7E9D61